MENEKPKGGISKVLVIVSVAVLVLLGGTTTYFYFQYQGIKKNPDQVARAELNRITKALSQLITLPKDETPTLATVKDQDKLKDQSFFANAKNGDVILIYTNAKKAILFREKDNRIINVGPISIDQQNGTPIALVKAGGNVDEVTKKINDKFAGAVTLVSTTDAKNSGSVKGLTVVDVTSNNADLAKQIAETIGGSVGSLPSGETAPAGANIVIYVK